mgnify:CR=1 FL=1
MLNVAEALLYNLYPMTTEENRMIDTKKEQERDDTVPFGQLRMSCGSCRWLGLQKLHAWYDVLQIYFRESLQLHQQR